MLQLEYSIQGIFDKNRLLELIRHFIVFEDDGEGALIKKMAGYHQYHAVRKAVETTVRAPDLREIGGQGLSGTPRDQVRALRWSFLRARSCSIRNGEPDYCCAHGQKRSR